MASQLKISNIYIYKEVNIGKYKTTRHYQLENPNEPLSHLSEFLNIFQGKKFTKSRPVYWLKNHNGKKWNARALTAIFPTGHKEFYFGDLNERQHLLLFRFVDCLDMLVVYYFENFYTNDVTSLIKIIEKLN